MQVDTLNDEDKDVYKKWWKRKQKKSGKNSDVQYAIRKQKEEKHTKIITLQGVGPATKALDSGKSKKEATKAAYAVVKESCKKLKVCCIRR